MIIIIHNFHRWCVVGLIIFLYLVTRDMGATIHIIRAIYVQLLHKLCAEATSVKRTSIGKAQLEVVWPLTNNCQRYLGTKTSPSMEANTLSQGGICATWECYRQFKMQLRVLTNLSVENGIAYHKGVKKHMTTKSNCQSKWWNFLPMCMPPRPTLKWLATTMYDAWCGH